MLVLHLNKKAAMRIIDIIVWKYDLVIYLLVIAILITCYTLPFASTLLIMVKTAKSAAKQFTDCIHILYDIVW